MTELPKNILDDIEQKVARFRQVVTNAAIKRLERQRAQTPRQSREQTAARHSLVFDLWLGGQHTIKQIAAQTGYSKSYVASVISSEKWDRVSAQIEALDVDREDWWPIHHEERKKLEAQRRQNKKRSQ